MTLLLGLDIGTSATKGVLCDAAGVVRTAASAPHAISHPRAGWSEQDPLQWWDAAVGVVRELLRKGCQAGLGADENSVAAAIAGVGLSGQMHGSVFLPTAARNGDGTAMPLRPALLWNDQRTAPQCAAIEAATGGRAALVQRSGNAALTGFTLPKILWLRDCEPEIFARTACVLLPKDFVRYRLTGSLATDVGDGAGTLLFDVAARNWSAALLATLGLPADLMPPVLESAAVAGQVTAWAAAQTGLRRGTPVVAGSGDNMCGAVGAGVVEPGRVLATLGTSGVMYAHCDAPRLDLIDPQRPGRLHTMCAADGRGPAAEQRGGWCVTGCMLSAAGALQWARDAVAPHAAYEALLDEAAQSPPGARGLVFLPYLTGERCPHPDPLARGAWIGLTARHTRGDLLRAVLEGVTIGMRQILDLMRSIGVPVSRLRLGGGGAKSQLWRQLQADVYGVDVEIVGGDEGPAHGAALLAGVGAGVWASVAEACRTAIRVTQVLSPTPAAAETYAAPRAVYGALYDDLSPRFAALAAIDAAAE